MNKYTHLEVIHQREYDWRHNLLKRSLPPRAFYNVLTSNILLAVERVFVKTVEQIGSISSYFQLR